MLDRVSIAQLNARVDAAREAIANPRPLGGLSAEEALILDQAGLEVLMNEVHARALADNEPAPAIVGGQVATFTVRPRTREQLRLARDLKIMAARSARLATTDETCPF